jgi:hypothetical protein
MTKELVIARYHEDLGWLEKVRPEVITTIYNKNSDMRPHWPVTNWVNLPNEGREAGSYYQHLVDNYETLADLTYFVQGNPFPHAPRLITQVNDEEQEDFWWLSSWHTTDNAGGAPNHCPAPGHLPVGHIYELIFGRSTRDNFDFGAGACFAVTRPIIQSKPQEFYAAALGSCRVLSPHDYPWAMERLWYYLFMDPL